MDSITQAALGATVGYAVLGRQLGRRAALYGAVLGTLPDLDVLIPYGGDIEDFTYHRGFSHSLILHALFTPLLAWLACRLPVNSFYIRPSFKRWGLMIFLVLATHALIDAATVYGTQLLWGLTEYPFAYAIFFIIDPLFTLPLVVACVVYCWPRLAAHRYRQFTHAGLWLSSVYMVFAVVMKWHVDALNHRALQRADIPADVYVSTPAPLTTLLWRSVVVTPTHYYEIYTSVFDAVDEVSITQYPTSPELLTSIQHEWSVQRLQWFTKGAFRVDLDGDSVQMTDLRMGVEDAYVFSFVVAERSGQSVVPVTNRLIQTRPSLDALPLLLQRIVDPSIALSPQE